MFRKTDLPAPTNPHLIRMSDAVTRRAETKANWCRQNSLVYRHQWWFIGISLSLVFGAGIGFFLVAYASKPSYLADRPLFMVLFGIEVAGIALLIASCLAIGRVGLAYEKLTIRQRRHAAA